MSLKSTILAGSIALLSISTASAQEMGHDHMNMQPNMGMKMGMSQPSGDQGPSSQAFAKANAKMHEDMALNYTGNADVDFARSMIPHHQGAIDMARIELQYGKDPEMRALAEDVIKAQEAEIKTMQDWLKAHAN
ncbi:DUF305 domain-containing protein [Rhizobium sp. BK251]|uniref:CopM family metallochaperone n=1 Tax=Rhizobium sp. BK251 TaxID=2512125 RepID=UPI00104CB2D2|nr:DUF305 domain-containing protein [Rhizobium sp. BK251]TCL75798.1 DUF305 family protein family protein [Rhizobium sp. BK251]